MSQDILKMIAGDGTDDIPVVGTPFLQVIQKASPQVDDTHKNFAKKQIPGCKPGDIFLTTTNKVVINKGTTRKFIPLAQHVHYVEFKPESAGGGFVGVHPLTITSNKSYKQGDGTEKGKWKEFLGQNELRYTIMIAGVLIVDDEEIKVVVPFTSTQLKTARLLLKDIAAFRWDGVKVTPPMYARAWDLGTEVQSNASGSWFGLAFKPNAPFTVEKDGEKLMAFHGMRQQATEAFKAIGAKMEAAPALTDSKAKETGDEDIPF